MIINIIQINKDYRIVQDYCMGYAVGKAVYYPSGTIAFYQQVSKWYQYKKCCIKFLERINVI